MDNLVVYSTHWKKIRLGRPNDGGYAVCQLPNNYGCLLSCGISDDVSFEKDFLKDNWNIPAFAFDGTISRLPEDVHGLTFIKKNIGNINTDEITNLVDFVKSFDDIFLKMDIEGHEFRVIPVLEPYFSKIKQIVIEIHTPKDIQLFPDYFKGLSDITNSNLFESLSILKKTHTLVHVHANNGCQTHEIDGIFMPNVFECTYIRNDYAYTKEKNSVPFPHAIDQVNNIYKPPIELKGYPWTV